MLVGLSKRLGIGLKGVGKGAGKREYRDIKEGVGLRKFASISLVLQTDPKVIQCQAF